jgi:hypothetical protein
MVDIHHSDKKNYPRYLTLMCGHVLVAVSLDGSLRSSGPSAESQMSKTRTMISTRRVRPHKPSSDRWVGWFMLCSLTFGRSELR